jgi:hypothetical protein
LRELFYENAKDWADEKEFRWVLWDRNPVHHFVNFGAALKGIIVGPDFDESFGPTLWQYQDKYGLEVAQLNWKNGVPEIIRWFGERYKNHKRNRWLYPRWLYSLSINHK